MRYSSCFLRTPFWALHAPLVWIWAITAGIIKMRKFFLIVLCILAKVWPATRPIMPGKNLHRSEKDDCCSNGVTQFALANKALPDNPGLCAHPLFEWITPSFYLINYTTALPGNKFIFFQAQSHHPPIPDIRIAIRSFQV